MSEWSSRMDGIVDSHVHMGEVDTEASLTAIRQATTRI